MSEIININSLLTMSDMLDSHFSCKDIILGVRYSS